MEDPVRSEQRAEDSSPAESTSEPPAGQEPLDASSLTLTCVSLLASKAWEAMGLMASPSTRKIERRLDDAQLAIDGAAALVDLVKDRVSETERRELDTLLMNLRLNFIEQRNKG